MAGVLGGTLLFVTGISMFAAPLITTIFAPGFVSQPEKFYLTTEMTRITFPYLISHFDDRILWRHTEQFRPLCRAGLHAIFPESVPDFCRTGRSAVV